MAVPVASGLRAPRAFTASNGSVRITVSSWFSNATSWSVEPSSDGSSMQVTAPPCSTAQPTVVPRMPSVPEGVRTFIASAPLAATSPVMKTKVPLSTDITAEPDLAAGL